MIFVRFSRRRKSFRISLSLHVSSSTNISPNQISKLRESRSALGAGRKKNAAVNLVSGHIKGSNRLDFRHETFKLVSKGIERIAEWWSAVCGAVGFEKGSKRDGKANEHDLRPMLMHRHTRKCNLIALHLISTQFGVVYNVNQLSKKKYFFFTRVGMTFKINSQKLLNQLTKISDFFFHIFVLFLQRNSEMKPLKVI